VKRQIGGGGRRSAGSRGAIMNALFFPSFAASLVQTEMAQRAEEKVNRYCKRRPVVNARVASRFSCPRLPLRQNEPPVLQVATRGKVMNRECPCLQRSARRVCCRARYSVPQRVAGRRARSRQPMTRAVTGVLRGSARQEGQKWRRCRVCRGGACAVTRAGEVVIAQVVRLVRVCGVVVGNW